MFLLLSSFLAGMLTSLAPCMITLLPVIVGNAALPSGDKKLDRKKPYIIAASLVVSVILFTVLLKASTALLGIDPSVWLYISGGIVILLGVSLLLPTLWVRISSSLGLEKSSNKLLAGASRRSGLLGQILTGAALGPVFSSCSPVYALVLATILPVDFAVGMIYIVAFALGLGLALLLISLGGRKIITKLGWAVNPRGWFTRGLAILLIIVGLAIIGGYDKKFQTFVIDKLPFDVTDIEQILLPKNESQANAQNTSNGGEMAKFNVDKPYSAPEITGIQDWINSDPQTLKSLKGKVVLVDFWTYSCINCVRTQPYLNAWHEKYSKDGLVILGLHAPEFAFEKVPENVRKAVGEARIKYPVALDNDFATWRAYKNQFWPAKYLIDKDGQVRYTHFGEGEYAETEGIIQTLLKEAGKNITHSIEKDASAPHAQNGQTPETYLGYERGERFANAAQFEADKTVNYQLASSKTQHVWSLGGNWQIGPKESVSGGEPSVLRINFSAKEVYLVMSGPADKPATLKLNGQPVTAAKNGGSDVDAAGHVKLNSARLYKLINLPAFTKNASLDITVPSGTTVNAFTFGS